MIQKTASRSGRANDWVQSEANFAWAGRVEPSPAVNMNWTLLWRPIVQGAIIGAPHQLIGGRTENAAGSCLRLQALLSSQKIHRTDPQTSSRSPLGIHTAPTLSNPSQKLMWDEMWDKMNQQTKKPK